jgi:hypothetical protein
MRSQPGGDQFDIRTLLPAVLLVLGPVSLGAEGRAGGDGISQTLAGVLGGPFHGRLRAPGVGHLFEQFDSLLKAVGDRPSQGGDPFQGRCQITGHRARGAVEGEQPLGAMPHR